MVKFKNIENLIIKRTGKQTILKLNDDCFGEEFIDSLIEKLTSEALSKKSIDLNPLTKEAIIKRTLESEEDYKKGDFITQEELEQKSLN